MEIQKFFEWVYQFWPFQSTRKIENVKCEIPFWAKKEYFTSYKVILGTPSIKCTDPVVPLTRSFDPNDHFIYLV